MNWLNYFEENMANRAKIPWRKKIHVETHLRAPLIRSLQRFQVGESGDGKHLKMGARTTGDESYAAAINLFIKEEQEHARLMAEILKQLGAELLKSHWSDTAFVLLRRLLGLKHELLILLVPEMIAKRYFRALHDGTEDPVLKAVFAQICRDEDGHLAFHIDTLQKMFSAFSILGRALIKLLWKSVFRAACFVVIVDHCSVLRACGVSPATFWWDCGLIFDDVAADIFTRAPSPAERRLPTPA